MLYNINIITYINDVRLNDAAYEGTIFLAVSELFISILMFNLYSCRKSDPCMT